MAGNGDMLLLAHIRPSRLYKVGIRTLSRRKFPCRKKNCSRVVDHGQLPAEAEHRLEVPDPSRDLDQGLTSFTLYGLFPSTLYFLRIQYIY